ncbi:MAG TPA: PKD domain-containing protein, partial [Thermoplasmata archaeon]|nr:PKD domain-containing protein [Thermoplasmata archaeon]
GGTLTDATDYPSSDPYVTAVGATVLTTSAGAYSSETGWSGNSSGSCDNGGGSGGGFSPYPRPAWQSAPGFPANESGRGIPDVSLVGGQGEINITMYGQEFGVGGTSAGTPMWADLEILADQYLGHRLGSLNPSLYALARIGPSTRYFHDVTTGSNGYNAGPGWDPVTGLGSPDIGNLLPALVAPTSGANDLAVQLFGAPRLGRTPLTTAFTVEVRGGVPPIGFVDVGFGDGNATMVPDPSGTSGPFEVNHTYGNPGVYAATATVVDASGNSTTGAPIAVVVGGGRALNVSLNLSTTTPALGVVVTLNASVTNGTGAGLFSYFFGDGTYLIGTPNDSVDHVYRFAGSFCAAVVAQDAASPTDGGASARIGVAVGGAASPVCPSATPLTAQLSAVGPSADLPGDLAFRVNTSGGIPPVSVQLTSDDPYVGACDCGIFSTPGTHEVRAYVNDSFAEEAEATTNVTLFPALTLRASSSATVGAAPLNVSFSVTPSGGHLLGPPSVNWSFGDGTTLKGASESPWHVYTTPGVYVATVLLEDQGGGRASAAWLLNVTPPGYAGLQVNATIAPAVAMPAGVPVTFDASAAGGLAPYVFHWNLGANDSAFGANATQSYSPLGCLGAGTCPLTIGLTVEDARGATWTRTFQLPAALRGRASAVNFTDGGAIADGVTPYSIVARASATGVLGLA